MNRAIAQQSSKGPAMQISTSMSGSGPLPKKSCSVRATAALKRTERRPCDSWAGTDLSGDS